MSITLNAAQIERLDAFIVENGLPTRSAGVRLAMEMGMENVEQLEKGWRRSVQSEMFNYFKTVLIETLGKLSNGEPR